MRTLALLILFVPLAAHGADHRVEAIDTPPPDELSAKVRGELQPTGHKVLRGTSRTVCEIWLCKQWPVKSLKPAGDVNYPLAPGQLIGAIRYSRRGSDFRDQDIESGVYTLRYGQQPVDGAHVGTSPTRDFLLLLKAEQDVDSGPLNYKTLSERSTEAAGTSHPALLSLQKVVGAGGPGSMRHEEEHDWWIARLAGKAKADGEPQPLSLDLVVVGQAAE